MPKKKNINKKKKNSVEVFSEAFPPNKSGVRTTLYSFSSYHEMIKGVNINKEQIIYKPLSKFYIDEIKKLHKEWFPIDYDDEYFQKIFTNKYNSYFTIGAFYTCQGQEIILGMALCQFRDVSEYFAKHTSKEVVDEICKNIDFHEEVQAYMRCEDYNSVYIMTIGVIDECRKLNIGSNLIKYIINKALMDNICIGVYLDVICYNTSAIKFYEKNGFKKVSTIKNYYHLKGELYDCEVFVKIFTREEKDDFRAKNYSFLRKIINKVILSPIHVIYKILIFILFFQCFRKKIKSE